MNKFPIFDIHSLISNKLSNNLFTADYFEGYLKNNPHVAHVHKHDFYHLVLFTKGKGQHVLDFKKYPIKEGIIYFMRPNQVHKWEFDSSSEGYVINFSDTFLNALSIHSGILENFPFFNYLYSNQVIQLDEKQKENIIPIFEDIISEVKNTSHEKYVPIMIFAHLLQLLVQISRVIKTDNQTKKNNTYAEFIISHFIQLVENKYKDWKLPNQYAASLNITSHHLNTLSKEYLNTSAGQFIRNRIILEAKRLLVNKELSVKAIAYELNFEDPSYFVKFFKKYTESTPEKFRQSH